MNESVTGDVSAERDIQARDIITGIQHTASDQTSDHDPPYGSPQLMGGSLHNLYEPRRDLSMEPVRHQLTSRRPVASQCRI